MEQPIENCEVGKQVFAEHSVEVEFDVGEAHEPRRIAQQAEQPAICDDGVKVLLLLRCACPCEGGVVGHSSVTSIGLVTRARISGR